jgi:uncharacterized SAM-binding protein YcdF (DUF218 family)
MAKKNLNDTMTDETSALVYSPKASQDDKKRKSSIGRMTLIAVSVVTMLLIGSMVYTASDFPTALKPVKADAVVLFMGSETDTMYRKKEADHIIETGYAQLLIVPAVQEVFAPDHVPSRIPDPTETVRSRVFNAYPRFYERTHIEALQAKKLMSARGLRSAIMVSSPYHMERIRLIVSNVFGDQANLISYAPTRYENKPASFWEMNLAYRKFEALEYIKICWFRMYSLFL